MIELLRPYQEASIEGLRNSLKTGHRRPILALSCGAGKTRIAGKIVRMALEKHKRVLFCVPLTVLVDQTAQSFEAEGIPVGIMQASHAKTNAMRPVQIASLQTLFRRELPLFDLAIIDECHLCFRKLAEIMAAPEYKDIPFIGLSATPWSKGLGKMYDDLIAGTTTKGLIEAGYLSPFKVYAPSSLDLSGVSTVAGEYHQGELSKVVNKPQIVGDIVGTWLKLGERRSTVCFAVDVAHAQSLWRQFQCAGVRAAYIDAKTPPEDRRFIKEGFHDGTYEVVINIGVLTAGADWDIRCLILAAPTKSEIKHVQQIGRAIRTAEGKDTAIIIDNAGNHLRLGFITDINHSRLHDGTSHGFGAEAPQKVLPKLCPQCQAVKQAGARKCEACGFESKIESRVRVAEGELIEFNGEKVAALRKKQVITKDVMQRWWSGLLWIERDKRWKSGAAYFCFKEKFGKNPRRVGLSETMAYPDSIVVSWVRSRQIARAKAKQVHPVAAE